jgi:hypothetical protein
MVSGLYWMNIILCKYFGKKYQITNVIRANVVLFNWNSFENNKTSDDWKMLGKPIQIRIVELNPKQYGKFVSN